LNTLNWLECYSKAFRHKIASGSLFSASSLHFDKSSSDKWNGTPRYNSKGIFLSIVE
jgi:hypothetical protein